MSHDEIRKRKKLLLLDLSRKIDKWWQRRQGVVVACAYDTYVHASSTCYPNVTKEVTPLEETSC